MIVAVDDFDDSFAVVGEKVAIVPDEINWSFVNLYIENRRYNVTVIISIPLKVERKLLTKEHRFGGDSSWCGSLKSLACRLFLLFIKTEMTLEMTLIDKS